MTNKENNKKKYLELFNDSLEPDRPNRLCVSLSDIHLTDGTVGFQNLDDNTWEEFYTGLTTHCRRHAIEEVTFILDGDVVDMIRSSRWAENDIYPWERERKDKFSEVINKIIKDILTQHKFFFSWLKAMKKRLADDTDIRSEDDINIVIILGNHDKELLCDNDALSYFYEHGLGISLDKFTEKERARLGRMYGDENMFADKQTAPYFPFYYADRGFRFFTTHGQWRDKSNSRKIYGKKGQTGWTAEDGWQNETWQELNFSPFLQPCFGDSIAAGLLSTFIYKVKIKLDKYEKERETQLDFRTEIKPEITRLRRIIEELDLYRPTYKAFVRILDEAKSMHNRGLVEIIE
ncbi:MAG: metallophosphoesterase, partial [Gammaproteobacteria bacterium]|nr:metallophosphoesterase [Gammaproteobacteria bacterium]